MAEQPNCARCGEQMRAGQAARVDSDGRPQHAGPTPCEASEEYASEQMGRLGSYLINAGVLSAEASARLSELLADGELIMINSAGEATAKSCPFRRYCDCAYAQCESTPKEENNAGS